MKRVFPILLFIGLAFGQKNERSTVGVGLILYNGDKTDLVNIGEKVVIFFKDSVEQEMWVKIKEITKEKVKIKELENGQTFEIELKNISRIDRNIAPTKARYTFTLIGAISAGGYVASVGNWDGGSESFVGMIITPMVATFGAGTGYILGSLSDISNKSNKQYFINDNEWKISIKEKKSFSFYQIFFPFWYE
tara:strand:- start:1437 stop:2012 length:576 start_codon:yes stop_codon:yes gene_type:complete